MAAVLVGGAAVMGATGAAAFENEQYSVPAVIAPQAAAVPQAGTHASLADMVEAVGASVVQIQVKPEHQAQRMGGAFSRDERMRRFFGSPMPERQPHQRASLGSGFIIDASGLVVTNNHVVADASVVSVQLSDGRELSGRVLGRDPKTDVAVVRIEGGGAFPAVRWGDSDRIRVGDSVFAVGSPFGLGNTVTSGIVSARSRELGAGPYDDFLQVDAAINSGNSGGPLFDANGRVVGVNTAIFSPSGGNVGIGFAIPARLAHEVAMQLAEHGSIARGRIGVALQDVTLDVAASLGLTEAEGALIAEVERDGPAALSGVRPGDVIRRFDGKAIEDGTDLARAVADAAVGSTVQMEVLRDGRRLNARLRIGTDAA
ncbi:trypsin-like peptidase domain-containing protein [Altericroceibacterium xinjiangense]|uniref:trypsin-like peptidase domain-containing protein n=1 Tax=Altericroceibacterium xinjiangense TaxID=762261 RepID=UPI0013DF1FFF|nr:trypsin-like peptidase domain-containing protein [Altericroceibacterium xinjiangense]